MVEFRGTVAYLTAEDYSVLDKLKATGTTVVDFTLLKGEVTGVEPRPEVPDAPVEPEARFPLDIEIRDEATDMPICESCINVQLDEGTGVVRPKPDCTLSSVASATWRGSSASSGAGEPFSTAQ